MDLLNATGEKLVGKYDGVEYEFPPGELIPVQDDAGAHMLGKLKMRGLQSVRYNDDPHSISFKAIRAIVAFHQAQIDIHEASNREQEEKKFDLLPEPDGVKKARRALKVYGPVYDELQAEAQKREDAATEKEILTNVGKSLELPDLEEMKVEDLRKTLMSMGGEPGSRMSKKKLIEAIRSKSQDTQKKLDAEDEGEDDTPDL